MNKSTGLHIIVRNVVIFGLLLIIASIFFSLKVSAGSNRIAVMNVDGTETASSAYTLDTAYPGGGYYSWAWTEQVSHPSDPYVIKVGGERIMVLLNDGTVYAKDTAYSNWVNQATNILWIDIGASGEMMVINVDGNVFSKRGTYDNWVQQIGGGGARDIAISATGRMMVIDSAGDAYSKESTFAAWVKQVSGADSICLGPQGQMGVINFAGNAYTKNNPLDPWVQQTNGGGTKVLSIGGNGRMMVIDSASNAYSKESTFDVWLKQVDGARWADVGSSGRMVIINSNWDVYYKDSPILYWNQIYRPSYSDDTYSYWVDVN